jgi:hypothetical protein
MSTAFLALPFCVVGVVVAVPEAVDGTIWKLVVVETEPGMTGVPVATRIEVGTTMLVAEDVTELFV